MHLLEEALNAIIITRIVKQHKSGMYTTGQGNYHRKTKCIKRYVDVRFDLIIVHSWLFYFVPLPMKGRERVGEHNGMIVPLKKQIKLNGSYSWVFRTLFIIRNTRLNLKYGKSI